MSLSNTLSGTPRWRPHTLLAVLLGLVCGVALDRLVTGAFIPFAASLNFELIDEAWDTIERAYVDRAGVTPRSLTYGAIAGMVNALGDTGHSRFLSPEMVKAVHQLEQNKFEGIGAEVRMKEGHVVIVAPLEGSPAMKAGLQPGDIILKIDGRSVAGLPLDQVVNQISGPAGTRVSLIILNPPSGETREITLTRARITIHKVTWRQLPGTALAQLRIASFNKGVDNDLGQALKDIKLDALQGLILDLRNNPGGLLSEAVGGASQFLSSGNVLLVKDAKGETRPIPVQPGGVATKIPMVALVNGGSASASEIVAGALHDAGRAILVGEQTFGTGTVLREFDLSDGSALLLAVEEWLTPKGHVIWHKGITPNVIVALPANATPLFPESEEGLTAEDLRDISDSQLLRAIELLGGSFPPSSQVLQQARR